MTNKEKMLALFKKDTRAMAKFISNVDCASGDECPAYKFCVEYYRQYGAPDECTDIFEEWLESEADHE